MELDGPENADTWAPPSRPASKAPQTWLGIALVLVLVFLVIPMTFSLSSSLQPRYPYQPSPARALLLSAVPWLPLLYVAGVHALAIWKKLWSMLAAFWITLLIGVLIFIISCFGLLAQLHP